MTRPNQAQIEYWNDRAAKTWTRLQQRLDEVFQPVTDAALAAASPSAGEKVLDVGCGCGATVLALAEKVGPNGQVLGLDISAPMAGRAQERMAEHGLRNAAVLVSDASVHPFEAAENDLLFSRFGVMFFEDPVAAFANLRTGVREGGRMLCACWRPFDANPWFNVPMQAARHLLAPQPPPEPHAPGPFGFADADRTLGILAASGWREAHAERQDVKMCFAPTGRIDQALDFALQVGPLARALADEADDTRARVRDVVAAALREYDTPEGVMLGGSVWLYTARI